jgi:hypothetical protein
MFEDAWQLRHELHGTGSLACWDGRRQAEAAAHKWVTADLVLVEALFAGPDSGVRLAPPWRVVAGDPDLALRFTPRPPIQRTEMGSDVHPVERAFDELKVALRAATRDAHGHPG